MSIHDFVSGYTGAFPDRLKQLLLANTTGTASTWTINDLWMKFLTERGYTSGSLDDRLRRFLLAYTGATVGTNADLWDLITEPFSEGSLPLDLFPGAVLAFSTGRKLRTNYSGPLFRVRRSSDNAEQDIGVVAETGIVNVAALTAFVGAGDGFVVTEYNQVEGGGLNATEPTASAQPAIVLAGVVQTLGTNALPAPFWDNVDDRLVAASVSLPGPQLSAWWACYHVSRTEDNVAFKYGTAGVSTGEFGLYSPAFGDGANTISFRLNSSSSCVLAISATPAPYVGRIRGDLSAGTPLEALRINGGAEAVGVAPSGTGFGASKNFHLGDNPGGGAGTFHGLLGEFILFNTLSPSSGNDIDTDMMNFWGIS